ncbi:dihydrofolate reductase family protein [Chitinophaga japonensis]|uniref:Dihydrofolate reductase n=1 Tax=Chitinophaga japonensis TaxID=104662 RepID=A0A562T7V0_CHIJA|nr:dihydrofolate reductase family protein [Chitinophaga japonensis]TWI88960.1 dihydrofolate reductase [Chitinophaga japonensis]
MRKLKLLVQISVDGYVGGPDGDLDWRTWTYDDKLKAFANNLRDSCDIILLGRKMAEGFIPHFEDTVNNLQAQSGDKALDEKFAYANRMVSMSKIVFSKTVKAIDGKNVSVENGDLVTAIKNLKSKEGKDMIVYGGAGFVSSLIKEGLIDEFNFFVNPVLINKGLRIFDLLEHRQKLSLVNAVPYECGIAVLTFSPCW